MNFTNLTVSSRYFSRNSFKNRTFWKTKSNVCVFASVWQIEATKCEHARFTYVHTLVQLSSVELNCCMLSTLLLCRFTWRARFQCRMVYSIAWCVYIHGVRIIPYYTYMCTVCAFIRKIEAYTDILSRIKPEAEKTPYSNSLNKLIALYLSLSACECLCA